VSERERESESVLASLLDHSEQMLVGVHLLVHDFLLYQASVLLLASRLRHELLVVDQQLVPMDAAA
jgi:hypothetical protein